VRSTSASRIASSPLLASTGRVIIFGPPGNGRPPDRSPSMRLRNRSDASTDPSVGRDPVAWRSDSSEAPMIADSFAARLASHSACPNCGLRRVASFRFCQGCGLDLEADIRSPRVRGWSVRGRAPAATSRRPVDPIDEHADLDVATATGPESRPRTVVGAGTFELTRRQVVALGVGVGLAAAALIQLIDR
jgi:hypothetical protein